MSDPDYVNPPELKIAIDRYKPESWNRLKRMHFALWHQEVVKVAWLMREAYGHTPPYFTKPVDISLVCTFTNYRNAYDSSNLPVKLFIDGLKGMVIEDDDHRFVRRVTCESRIDPSGPSSEITITPTKKMQGYQFAKGGLNLVIGNHSPQSWNKLKRMNKHKWQKEVRAAAGLIQKMTPDDFGLFTSKVDIFLNLYTRGNVMDSDNVPLKLYEDGLIHAGILKDDSPKYVRRIQTMSVPDYGNPRMELIVAPISLTGDLL